MASTGQVFVVNDTLPNGADQVKLERIEKKLTHSPHYKNPNAASRLLVFNRNAPAPTASKKESLTGPAYKNRRRGVIQSDTTTTPTATRRKLIGPRYKNRSAKSRRFR